MPTILKTTYIERWPTNVYSPAETSLSSISVNPTTNPTFLEHLRRHLRLNMSKHCVHEFPFHLHPRHISSLLGLPPHFQPATISKPELCPYFGWSMLPHQHVLSSCTSPPRQASPALFMPPSSPSWTTDWSSWLQCCTYQSNNYTVIKNSKSPDSFSRV